MLESTILKDINLSDDLRDMIPICELERKYTTSWEVMPNNVPILSGYRDSNQKELPNSIARILDFDNPDYCDLEYKVDISANMTEQFGFGITAGKVFSDCIGYVDWGDGTRRYLKDMCKDDFLIATDIDDKATNDVSKIRIAQLYHTYSKPGKYIVKLFEPEAYQISHGNNVATWSTSPLYELDGKLYIYDKAVETEWREYTNIGSFEEDPEHVKNLYLYKVNDQLKLIRGRDSSYNIRIDDIEKLVDVDELPETGNCNYAYRVTMEKEGVTDITYWSCFDVSTKKYTKLNGYDDTNRTKLPDTTSYAAYYNTKTGVYYTFIFDTTNDWDSQAFFKVTDRSQMITFTNWNLMSRILDADLQTSQNMKFMFQFGQNAQRMLRVQGDNSQYRFSDKLIQIQSLCNNCKNLQYAIGFSSLLSDKRVGWSNDLFSGCINLKYCDYKPSNVGYTKYNVGQYDNRLVCYATFKGCSSLDIDILSVLPEYICPTNGILLYEYFYNATNVYCSDYKKLQRLARSIKRNCLTYSVKLFNPSNDVVYTYLDLTQIPNIFGGSLAESEWNK